MSFQDDQVFLEKYLDENLNTVLGLRLAEKYISSDNLEGAHQTLTEFLESHPDNSTAMFMLGEIAFKEGNNEKAQNLYEETIQADPSYTAAYHRLVTISTDNGDEATVKDIYALLNRVNPLDSRAASEVGNEGSETSLKSEFSKKVLNQFTLTTAEPEEEIIIKSSKEDTESTNIPLGGSESGTDVEIEEVSDEESPFDSESAGETKEAETTDTDDNSIEETAQTDTEDSDAFGVTNEHDESIEADSETESDISEPEDSSESEIEESEEDNPFGVGAAEETEQGDDDSDQPEDTIAEEPIVEEETAEEESEEESSETADDEEESTEETDSAEETEQGDDDSDQPEDTITEEPVVEEESADEESEEESTETADDSEESTEEADSTVETEQGDDDSDQPEDTIEEEPVVEEESAEEQAEEAIESSDVDPFQEKESDTTAEKSTEEDEATAEETDLTDSIVDKESRGFELPPFSKETLADISTSDQDETSEESEEEAVDMPDESEEVDSSGETTEEESTLEASDQEEDPFGTEENVKEDSTDTQTQTDEDNKNSSQDEGADAFSIPLDTDSEGDTENSDNSETTTEDMLDDAEVEELNLPIDQQEETGDAGLDTPSDYESWVEKDVTPESMTSGGDDNDNDLNKSTFEGLLSEPDVAVETLETDEPDEEVIEGTIEEVEEDFHKRVDNIYNLDEEEEISPLQAWFLEKKSDENEERINSEETTDEIVEQPLTEPKPVPFSDEESKDENDSDKSDDNDEAWDDFVETAIKGKTDLSEDSESIVTEVDRELQNIFDDVVAPDSDNTDKQDDEVEKTAPIGGVKLNNDLATFTLAEIYTNQGQYTEALSVLDLLENKGESSEKISSMREDIKVKMEAKK